MPQFDITIAGEINLDLILYGLAEQMPVERELLADDFRLTLGSSSAIFAHNLAALGMKVGFVTRIGTDPLGQIALDRLRAIGVAGAAGVDVSRTTISPTAQTGVTILLHHGATRHILTYPGTMAEMTVAHLDQTFLADSRHFHLSSIYLQKALQPGLPELCRQLKQAGLTLSLDTNDDPEDIWGDPLNELLDLVDIFLPNAEEALRITRCDDLDQAINILAKRVPLVAVKCGRAGSIVQKGSDRWTVPPPTVEPLDTIGAGDSYNAGFLKAWLSGQTPERCAATGNVTAALSTLRPGGTEAYRDSTLLQSFLAQHLP
jgi:sugar/nucleoside kinase (ribokinase family)